MYREIQREISTMKLFAKVFVLVIVSATLFVPVSYAKGKTNPVTVILEKDETVNKDYFAAGDTVKILGTVNGDAYIAGGTVFIDGIINGDLLVAGGTVQINGTVKNDVRALGGAVSFGNTVGGNVTVGAGTTIFNPQAKIGGSLLAGAGTLDLYSPVGRGVIAGAGTFTLNNTVGGDMMVAVEEMVLQSKTKVTGDVTYWSEKEAAIADNVALSGDLVYHRVERNDSKPSMTAEGKKGFLAAVAGLGIALVSIVFITTFITGMLIMWLLPAFTDKTVSYMQKNTWSAFGMGIVAAIFLPILSLTAMVTVVGIPLGIFLGALTALLCLMGQVYAALFIGKGIFRGMKADVHRNWQLLVGLVILGILSLIPIFGWLARMVFVLIGIGAVLFEKSSIYRQMKAKHLV